MDDVLTEDCIDLDFLMERHLSEGFLDSLESPDLKNSFFLILATLIWGLFVVVFFFTFFLFIIIIVRV